MVGVGAGVMMGVGVVSRAVLVPLLRSVTRVPVVVSRRLAPPRCFPRLVTPRSTVLILEETRLRKVLILLALQLRPEGEKARRLTLVGATVTSAFP